MIDFLFAAVSSAEVVLAHAHVAVDGELLVVAVHHVPVDHVFWWFRVGRAEPSALPSTPGHVEPIGWRGRGVAPPGDDVVEGPAGGGGGDVRASALGGQADPGEKEVAEVVSVHLL